MKRRIAKQTQEATVDAQARPAAPGEFMNIEVNPADIGADLLPILSRGLYTDPFHAIREYVQNSVDSGAAVIRIKLTGNSIVIRDDGGGMSFDDLVKARRFGVSEKDPTEHVGFRGIGIYSGYDLCDRLVITTYSRGDTMQSVLEFNFAAMKKRLDADKRNGVGTPLHDLLKKHTRFKIEPSLTKIPGTTVELEEVSSYHIRSLRDSDALHKYILRNLPVDFDQQFEHWDTIKKYLREHVPGYRTVKMILEIREGETRHVVRPTIPQLDAPATRLIKAPGDGATIAVLWACLHKKRSRIPDAYEDYHGFTYRTKGFAVGDSGRMQLFFRHGGSTLYAWYTGEVYVVDDRVIPNTERDDFEANAAYDVLKSQIKLAMEELDDAGLKFQSEGRAAKKLKESQRKLRDIEQKVADKIGDPAIMFSALEDIIKDLKLQRTKLPAELKDEGKAAEKLASDLRAQVHKTIMDGQKRRTGRDTGSSGRAGGGGATDQKADEEQRPLRLASAVEEVGIQVSEPIAKVFALIEEVLAAVLRPGTREFSAVLEGIESGLSDEFGAED